LFNKLHSQYQTTRELAAERFKEFENLSESCKSRLVVENDDSLKSPVQMLYNMVYKVIGIPNGR
jgi:UV DNA damage repair endonuclease